MSVEQLNPSQQRVVVVRVAPGRETQLDHCLATGEIVIGWEDARGLIDEFNWERFRARVAEAHYPDEPSLRKAGAAAGHLWRFLHELSPGDLVVVPAPGQFYVARAEGEPREIGRDGVGYVRSVEWLNNAVPIDRSIASARLQSRMKVYGSTASATDLREDVLAVLRDAVAMQSGGARPSFETDLRSELLKATLAQMRLGRVDSFKFEQIVRAVLLSLGASEATITARRLDQGDDIVANFHAVGGLMEIKVCVQVKHYNETSRPLEPSVVSEVRAGMRKVGADLGLIITVGTVSDYAKAAAAEAANEGDRIVVLDGEELAELYLDYCVGKDAVSRAGR